MKLENNHEIYEILNNLGLEDDEISSVTKRNKLLKETTADEVNEILDFFSTKCNLGNEEIARLIIRNPLILNESFERMESLYKIYSNIGFSKKEYKKYISNYEKAFSLNPKDVIENITKMLNSGKDIDNIKLAMTENARQIF